MLFLAVSLMCLQLSLGLQAIEEVNGGGNGGDERTVHSQIVCENDDARLDCTGGRTVNVVSAAYGRTVPDSEVCPYGRAQRDDTNCVMENAFRRVSRICNHRQRCVFKVNNDRMNEDPCGGTYKYLNVSYTCETRGLKLAVSCDDEVTVYLDGEEQVYSGVWWRPSFLNIPMASRVLGVECKNTGNFAGVVATFSDGETTGPDGWKCSNEAEEGWSSVDFDDSQWPAATAKQTPESRGTVLGMSSAAQWIWTNDTHKPKEERDTHVYCRYQIRADSYCTAFAANEVNIVAFGAAPSKADVLAPVFQSACRYEVGTMSSESEITAMVADLQDIYNNLVKEDEPEPVQIAEIQEAPVPAQLPVEDSESSSSSGSAKMSFMDKLKEKMKQAHEKTKLAFQRLKERRLGGK